MLVETIAVKQAPLPVNIKLPACRVGSEIRWPQLRLPSESDAIFGVILRYDRPLAGAGAAARRRPQ